MGCMFRFLHPLNRFSEGGSVGLLEAGGAWHGRPKHADNVRIISLTSLGVLASLGFLAQIPKILEVG